MAHKSVTHSDSEDMRKVPHTIIGANGIYRYNRRYPRDLVEAGLVLKDTKRVSLKTRNPAEARKKAAIETLKFEAEVEELRCQFAGGSPNLPVVQNPGSSRPLSSLSGEEKNDLMIQWFVEVERIAEKLRSEIEELEGQERVDAIRTVKDDASIPKDDPHRDDEGALRRFLSAQGISVGEDEDLEYLLSLSKRADEESINRTIQFLEGRRVLEGDPFFSGLRATTELKASEEPSHTVGDICTKYPNRKQAGKLAPGTLVRYEPQIRAFREFFGEHRPLNTLKHEDGEAFVRFLNTIPTNVKKHKKFAGRSLLEAAKIEAALPEAERKILSPKSQRDTLNTVLAILNYAEQIRWLERNPFSGRALSDLLPEPRKKEVCSFTSDDLTKMLSSEMFLREKRKEGQGRYWVTLIGLLHGVRQNEAASLLIDDIKEEGQIPYFAVRTTDDDGNVVKRLKTVSSKRRVPLHKELIRMGFLDYVEMRKSRTEIEPTGKGFLFDELKPDPKTGNRAKVLSQWFGRLRNKTIPEAADREGKSFHSFRHEVTDRVRALTESDEKRYALLGWTSDNEKKNAGYDYGTGFSISSLKELVDQIEFPGFDPSILYPENLDRSGDQ